MDPQEHWGIHMADELAGTLEGHPSQDAGLEIFHCNVADVQVALTPEGTLKWQIESRLYDGLLTETCTSSQLPTV